MFKTISFILFLAAVISANSYYIPEYLQPFKPDFKPMEMHKPHFKNIEDV